MFNDDRAGRDDLVRDRRGRPGAVFRFLESLKLIMPATTLGDVYSLILYPAISSHRALTPEQRAEIGIGDGLVRLSVGIEDAEDIMADLDQALHAAVGRRRVHVQRASCSRTPDSAKIAVVRSVCSGYPASTSGLSIGYLIGMLLGRYA